MLSETNYSVSHMCFFDLGSVVSYSPVTHPEIAPHVPAWVTPTTEDRVPQILPGLADTGVAEVQE